MNLEEIRTEIDQVDAQLTQLLEARMNLVLQVAAYKKTRGTAIRDSKREQVVLDKVAGRVQNPDYTESIVSTYQDILAHSREYQEKLLRK